MLKTVVVEDNLRLQGAMCAGLAATGLVQVLAAFESGEALLDYFLATAEMPEVTLMDVALAGELNGIETAIALRREFPRAPVVFYSIQDDDAYYRAFIAAGILSHYAYVRKSNYLLPTMVAPLLQDAARGLSFVDPEVELRVQEVRRQDAQAPLDLLEPNEQIVARMLAAGLSNEQIAERLGFRDKRTISRINGQIYAAWGLAGSSSDEKIARTRAALIVLHKRLFQWDAAGVPHVLDERGNWVVWQGQ